MPPMPDKIFISELEVQSRIGVTAEERKTPQRLLIDIEFRQSLADAGRSDNIRKTIDYDYAAKRVKALAEGRERNLIETLAEEIAAMLVKEFRPNSVWLRVKKFPLPGTRYVAVEIERERLYV